MPTSRFSRRTIIAAIDVLEQLTHAKLSRYLLELGPDFPRWVGGEGISVRKRLNNLIGLIDQYPNRPLGEGRSLENAIIEKAASLIPEIKSKSPWEEPPTLSPAASVFLSQLERDGFKVTNSILHPILPVDVGLPQAEIELMRLLNKHRFTTPKGHLDQALDAFVRGNWAAANSQLRTFFDALLDDMAGALDGSVVTMPSGQARRAKLAAMGLLSRDLNEWEDNGHGFINGLIKRLHPRGAHPGLSDEKDSTFRLHIVLLTAQLLLSRFDGMGTT